MNKNYIIEMDDSVFRLEGDRLADGVDIPSVEGCQLLISDLERSISRVITVEADIRYAEAMVARTLQEEGEFDEPVSVITHWKKKRGKKHAEIFFTALPSRIYFQYLDKIEEHNDLLILIPVFSILASLTKKLAKNKTIAIVFRHHRFADLVVGDAGQFYFAARTAAFDTSQEQINALWETVEREVEQVAREKMIQVDQLVFLNWIDAREDMPEMSISGIEQYHFHKEQICYNNDSRSISFAKAVNLFSPLEGISTKNGKLLYYADKLSWFITAFLIAAIMALQWNAFSYQSKTTELEKTIGIIENRIAGLKNDITVPAGDLVYEDTLIFIDQILNNSHLPSCRDIINDISNGMFASVKVKQIKIDYSGRKVNISLAGDITNGFNSAHKGYQRMLSRLVQKGYVIVKSAFKTRIDSSTFELDLSWSVK